jgi:hypothetical protein
VLGLAVRREPARVGSEEGEGRLLVLAVLGEVVVHPPDDVPGRIHALEEFLDRGTGLGLRPRRTWPRDLRAAGQRGVYAILGAAFIVGTALLFGLGARIKPCSPRPVRLWVLGAFGFLMVANALRR